MFLNSLDIISITCFTSSLSVLDKLGDQVLGYDTDSCWYVDRPGGNTIGTGDNLGDLTDELKGCYITKWTGTGPQSYAYEKNNGDVECKVKGFTLNYTNALKINADVMNEIIPDPSKKITIGRKNAITRDAKTKTFSLGYDKCVVQSNFDTLPYGF